jgi:hypothetical protein
MANTSKDGDSKLVVLAGLWLSNDLVPQLTEFVLQSRKSASNIQFRYSGQKYTLKSYQFPVWHWKRCEEAGPSVTNVATATENTINQSLNSRLTCVYRYEKQYNDSRRSGSHLHPLSSFPVFFSSHLRVHREERSGPIDKVVFSK